MKTIVTLLFLVLLVVSCHSTKSTSKITSNDTPTLQAVQAVEAVEDTVRIANDSLEYEILIIEPGFNSWLVSTAKPEGYYSQQYMENRNIQYVIEWNQRVMQPQRYNSNLYELQIDYRSNIDYGYEVNYKLYNYFIYFQLTYDQRLGYLTPRI